MGHFTTIPSRQNKQRDQEIRKTEWKYKYGNKTENQQSLQFVST